MAIHFIEAVKYLDLPPSHKLVMVAFADSADSDSRLAWPGLDAVMQWASVRKSRALEIVNDLCCQGHLVKIKGSAPGRRAEFLVLPRHTCSRHSPLPGYEDAPTNGSAVSDVNGSDAPDVNGSGFAANGSDPGPEQVRSAGPPPLVTPSSTPPRRATHNENAERIRAARQDAGLALGPSWSESAICRALDDACAAVVGATQEDASIVLAALAARPDTDSPGRLVYRLEPLTERTRLRARDERTKREREVDAAERAAAKAAAVDASTNPAWSEFANRFRRRADDPEGETEHGAVA